MKSDPLIDEVRKSRHAISARFGHEPKRLIAYYRKREKELRATGKHQFLDNPTEVSQPTLDTARELTLNDRAKA